VWTPCSRGVRRESRGGDVEHRLRQEIVLGIGALPALRALDIHPQVFHTNEGHAGFLGLERIREWIGHGLSFDEALEAARAGCVFTTHTPVWAGHDRFNPGLLLESLKTFKQELGMSDHELMSWGRVNPDDTNEQFTMTVLGLKLSRSANGVSRLNGEVARRQWAHMFPDRHVDDEPRAPRPRAS